MTNGTFELTRRKILAGLGTAGVAGATAGLGTSAYFSDTENFEDNELVAGELDLKVEWTEHYSDWSDDEAKDLGEVSMDPGDGLTGFPSTAPREQKMVYVDDPQQFMANTAIEAFPDVDPRKDEPTSSDDYDGRKFGVLDDDICDVDSDLDGVLSSPYRTGGVADTTIGGEPNPQTTSAGDSLVKIEDVKPGDFGEVTFGFHVCGNPGRVWLTGALSDAAENDHTEPEADADGEQRGDDPDVDGEYVELLDEIRAAIWYDTGEDGVYGATRDDKDTGEGDNIFGTSETLLPMTGSLRSVLRALDGMHRLDPEPVSTGGGTGGGGSSASFPTVSGDPSTSESGHLAEGPIVTGEDDRFGGASNYRCADYETNLSDFEEGDIVGSEILNPDTATIAEGASYNGCTTITVDEFPGDGSGDITLSSTGPVLVVSVKGGPDGEQIYVFSEPVILDEASFTTPGSRGLSNVDVCCPTGSDGDDGTGGGTGGEDGRECFPNSTTAYIGFEWWLPVDAGNEVQSDSVSFDLGFYTEQCRHNDGSGRVS